MVMTRRGIYHNLDKSEYAVSNGEIAFFFSSKLYLGKFMDGYKDHREVFIERLSRTVILDGLNANLLADIHFYKDIEKRGFKSFLFEKMAKNVVVKDQLYGIGRRKYRKRGEIDWQDLQKYALARMTRKSTLDWSEMHVLK